MKNYLLLFISNIIVLSSNELKAIHGTSLKLVDKFTYLGSSVSSTEKDIDTSANEGMDSYR